ncbi:MAG: hypothetical protein ACRBB6_04690 [Neptuniibacter sp.]
MKKIILAMMMACLTLNVYAAKPENVGNKEGKKAAKAEMKAAKKLSKSEVDSEKENRIVSDNESILEDIFSEEEKSIIEDYYNRNAESGTGKYKGKKKELPKGLQKKLERGGELPPGWQKKLARGEVLDPELRYRSENLPEDLLSTLSGNDAANEILRIQDKIIRVSKGQGTIIDMIDLADILTGRGMRKE